MDLLFTPTTLVALGTLVLLEVVLGIDNLLFIAILAERLPPEERNKARYVGLALAMLMRLGLLSVISWIVTLTTPLFSIGEHSFSWRHIILLSGGLFLLFKATRELHERLESDPHSLSTERNYAGFWMVVAQIVVLDAVFSLDAVITAVGMVDHLPIMMMAVIIAIGIMMLAANPLAKFVAEHPTVVVLCLSFLLLIGLSLISEGLGFALPKGYLYAAIGFSVLIESFNQIAAHNIRKHERRKPLRVKTAEAVLRLLGSETQLIQPPIAVPETESPLADSSPTEMPVFAAEEVDMVSRVLTLSERTARSIMTYRADTIYVDLDMPIEEIRTQLLDGTPEILPVCRGGLDNVLGVAYAVDLLSDIIRLQSIAPATLQEASIVPESMRVNNLLKTLRDTPMHLVLVTDEYGSIEGVVTLMDIFEAITGTLPEEGEPLPVVEMGEGWWRMVGTIDVHYLEHTLDLEGIVSESNDYTSLAGFILARLGRLPEPGDSIRFHNYTFNVVAVSDRRITLVDVIRINENDDE